MPTDDKSIALLLGGPSPKDAPAGESIPAVSDEETAAAADDVFTALKNDDKAGFAEALHSYFKLCSMGEG